MQNRTEQVLDFQGRHLCDVPVLGFGTSRLGHHTSIKDAIQTLEVAYDLGINYFDTAPIYGFGWSEKILGRFLSDKRSKTVIATKVGLQSSALLSHMPLQALNLLRKAVTPYAGRKKNSTPIGVKQINDHLFDEKKALQSLERSLKRLKTDYVDVLLLHEATIQLVNSHETVRFMERVISEGKTRSAGIGSSSDKIGNVTYLHPVYTFLQHDYSIADPTTSETENRVVNTYGLFRNFNWVKSLANVKSIQEQIFDISGLDINKDKDILNLCLSGVKYVHPSGIHLFTSTNHEHIKETISAWNQIRINYGQFHEVITLLRKHTTG